MFGRGAAVKIRAFWPESFMHGLNLNSIVLVFAVLVAIAAAGKAGRGFWVGDVRYVQRRLMTDREFEFFGSLRRALPEAVIHCQVAMAALVDVNGGKRSARNSFDRKIFDFVVCRADGHVLYVIELDDRSHRSASALRRDAVKDEIARAAGLRLVRYGSVKTDAVVLRRDFEMMAAVDARPSV
jgi:very-short-patch-repair endonuclease